MNYALDALWWELKTEVVRDLASLLTAPSLWLTECELSRRELLGEHGFRYLLTLDAHPEILHNYLQQLPRSSHRLGFYAEDLLAFWLSHAPHCQLLGQNIVLQQSASTPTLGALDFVTIINDQCYHLELTCKYYAHRSAQPKNLRGIQFHDTLAQKAAKLEQQLALSQHELFSVWCEQQRRDVGMVRAASVVRGMGFWQEAEVQQPVNPYAWRGDYIENWQVWPHVEACRYATVPSKQLLSPLRLEQTATVATMAELPHDDVWRAQLQLRPDGFWHEINRGMCLSAHD